MSNESSQPVHWSPVRRLRSWLFWLASSTTLIVALLWIALWIYAQSYLSTLTAFRQQLFQGQALVMAYTLHADSDTLQFGWRGTRFGKEITTGARPTEKWNAIRSHTFSQTGNRTPPVAPWISFTARSTPLNNGHVQYKGEVNIPHWIIVTVLGGACIPALFRVKRRFRRDPSRCRKCRYDLTGLPDTTTACPECGKPFKKKAKVATA